MQHLIRVRPEPPGQFTAEALGIPEIQVTSANKEEAIQQVRRLLKEWLDSGRLVPVGLAGENPLLKWCGWAKEDPLYDEYLEELARFRQEDLKRTLQECDSHAKDDPDFELYLEEIRRYRQEVDERECSDSSSF